MIYLKNISFKELNFLHVDNYIKHFFVITNAYEIYVLLYLFNYFKVKYYVIGNASKILFCKNKVNKAIIYINFLFEEIHFKNDYVLASAGISLQKLILTLAKANLGGFESLYPIPASLGGAIYMNAGDKNVNISSYIKGVYIIDEKLNFRYIDNKMCDFSYRSSIFKNNNWTIVYALIKYDKIDKNIILNNIKEAINYRFKVQDCNKFTCGSLFKNTNNYKAYELLSNINASKYNFNGAKISNKHANFLVNESNAKSKDFIKLIKTIKKEVLKKYKINLQLELNLFK